MRIMTVRQLVMKMTKELGIVHDNTRPGTPMNPDDLAKAKLVQTLVPTAFPKTKDYLNFMRVNDFLNNT